MGFVPAGLFLTFFSHSGLSQLQHTFSPAPFLNITEADGLSLGYFGAGCNWLRPTWGIAWPVLPVATPEALILPKAYQMNPIQCYRRFPSNISFLNTKYFFWIQFCNEQLSIFLKQNLKDEWTLKATELQKMNSRGTLLCSLISAVTSPAKLRAVAKSGMHSHNQVSLSLLSP